MPPLVVFFIVVIGGHEEGFLINHSILAFTTIKKATLLKEWPLCWQARVVSITSLLEFLFP